MSAPTATRERPILFSDAMVRAILDGTKTQTRRVVKLTYRSPQVGWRPAVLGGPGGGRTRSGDEVPAFPVLMHDRTGHTIPCPYGEPGDRLWVRETWSKIDWVTIIGGPPRLSTETVYRAGPHPFGRDIPHGWTPGKSRWRSPIHMPRRASRLTLTITDVRVERVQDISEGDALAEGVEPGFRTVVPFGGFPVGATLPYHIPRSHRGGFANLWDELNEPRGHGWDANPWVWVVSFVRVTP